ncbi:MULTISPECIES: hypothetical protein [Kribbella]|jgi:hypothetical protein|uniref:Uncharacterized protein n=1 Tax=Kribbella pratensis TaxID=2512112 RepID=A0A4R8CGG9_9ACTN|nr:hypothetical protein [Kribbella pratensis]TDW75402.1 hypothetical protein EV653_0532 [Kribbella pratensis]
MIEAGPDEGNTAMGWFIFLVIVVGAIAAYKYRVPLLAKVLGQPQDRIQRAIDRKKGK